MRRNRDTGTDSPHVAGILSGQRAVVILVKSLAQGGRPDAAAGKDSDWKAEQVKP